MNFYILVKGKRIPIGRDQELFNMVTTDYHWNEGVNSFGKHQR